MQSTPSPAAASSSNEDQDGNGEARDIYAPSSSGAPSEAARAELARVALTRLVVTLKLLAAREAGGDKRKQRHVRRLGSFAPSPWADGTTPLDLHISARDHSRAKREGWVYRVVWSGDTSPWS